MAAQYNGGASLPDAGGHARTSSKDEASDAPARIRWRLDRGEPAVLDGATGTELERAGVDCALPLWSTRGVIDAPDVLRGIHRAYAAAGVDALTAGTFRTQAHVLSRAGLEGRAAELTAAAVGLARAGAEDAGRAVDVLGSAPPLEDCYRPDLTPEAPVLRREHERHAVNLARAGVDAVWAETHPTIREAVAAASAAREAALAVGVCFVCGNDGRLLSGEPLDEALDAVSAFGPFAVGVNCVPVEVVATCLATSGPGSALPWAVLANLGAPGTDGVRSHDRDPSDFAEEACRWVRAGVRIVGGCCGTRPEHLAAVVARLRESG